MLGSILGFFVFGQAPAWRIVTSSVNFLTSHESLERFV